MKTSFNDKVVGENIRVIYDIIQYTEENNISGLLLSGHLYIKSWNALVTIISWIKTFNNNVQLSVNQCGNLSSFFGIGCGCPQGDPVSIFLFILCAEILGIMIRNNMSISDLFINEKEHKLSQYADDTLFLLDGTSKSLNATLKVLYDYSHFSGLKLNFKQEVQVALSRSLELYISIC